jgi:hypothetical protein
MTPAALLRQLDSLTHAGRMHRLVELGQQSLTNPRLAAALARLEEGGFHERLLSLQACYGSRDAERILRGLSDPSREIRSRAARLLVEVGDDQAVLRGLPALGRKQIKRALSRLRKAGRQGSIDTFLDELARRGDRALEVLLPYGSDRVVNRHQAVAVDRGGSLFLTRLARHHPRRAVAIVDAHCEKARRGDHPLHRLCHAVLPVLARWSPDEAIGLARRLARLLPLTSLSLDLIALYRPRDVAQLALDTKTGRLGVGFFNRHAWRLGPEQVRELAQRQLVNLAPASLWSSAHPYRWLERLPPALRGELFTLIRGKEPHGIVDIGLLSLLPAELRLREARRCLTLPSLATKPASRLPHVAFLDWDEARELVEPFLRHPDAALRGVALQSLAGVLRFQRGRAADYLALVRARKNEQDPVRMVMLQALASVPVALWQETHLDDLGGVIREALDARDLSQASANWASFLVLRLLRRYPDWSARWLTTLIRERGRLAWHSLEPLLTDEDVRRVGPVLLPVLKAWRSRERDSQLLFLAGALGRLLRSFEALLDLVENIVRTSRVQGLAQHGLGLIAQHARARLRVLVPRLLQDDPSWIVAAPVWQHLHQHRQDLLTPFLGQRSVRGRFLTGKTRWVLPIHDGFSRWTGAQRDTFATTLREVIADADPTRDTPAICQALRQLAAMPGVAHDELIRRASDKRQVIRDTAVSLLGSLDTGAGVPVLLEAMGDDRARVAIYALRQALLDMPAAHSLGLLRGVPRDKVTVAKEVMRLVGELDGDEAFTFLEEAEAAGPHRDVRVALLRAVWPHLERPAAWAMIGRAVEAGDPALMHTVVRIPADRLSGQARARLTGLLIELLGHADATVRLEVLQRCAEEPPGDPERELLRRVVEAVDSPLPEVRRMAARAAVALSEPGDGAVLARAARQLLPHRQAIMALAESLLAGVLNDARRVGPGARAVVAVLAEDPLAAPLRLRLASAALGPRALVRLFSDLDAARWRADVLMTGANLLESGTPGLSGRDLKQLESALVSSSSPALRRLALAALLGLARQGHWDGPRLERLESYRRDPDPLVASAAQFYFPPDEEEEEEDVFAEEDF